MAAYPFGGQPTLARYLEWAHGAGCTSKSGVVLDSDGRPFTVTQIIAPSKRWVSIVGTQHSEFLVSTMVGFLDRRLGMKSPFFSLDFPELDPET